MGIESNQNLFKLGLNSNKLLSQQPLVKAEPESAVLEPTILSVNRIQVKPEEVLTMMVSTANLSGVTINTDMQNQMKLESARVAVVQAKEALDNNTDLAKMEELQRALDKALENYEKVLKELAKAGYLEAKTEDVEYPTTRATSGCVRSTTESIYENGLLVSEEIIEYDANDNVIQRTCKYYDYDFNNELSNVNEYVYSNQGERVNSKCYRVENGRSILVSMREYSTETNPLIGKDGEEIDSRTTYAEGEEVNGASVVEYKRIAGGKTEKFYDKDGNLIREGAVYSDEHSMTTSYCRDELGRIVKEYSTIYDGERRHIESRRVSYTYNSDGSYVKEIVVTNEIDNTKTKTVEKYNTEGVIVEKMTITYDENGNIVSEITQKGGDIGETPVNPLGEDVNVSEKDVSALLNGLGTVDLTGWVKAKAQSTFEIINIANSALKQQIDSLASKLKDMGYNSIKVDSAIVTLERYYIELLDKIYDDDNKLQKKGESCAVEFTYNVVRDSDDFQHVSTSFRHYAFDYAKNADAKMEQGATESESGVVLLENTGSNHGYKIAIDMKKVAQMLIGIFNAL